MQAIELENRIRETLNVAAMDQHNERCFLNAIRVLSGYRIYYFHWLRRGYETTPLDFDPAPFLKCWGISFTRGNSAPRGGAEGKYIELSEAGREQVKDWQKFAEQRALTRRQAALN